MTQGNPRPRNGSSDVLAQIDEQAERYLEELQEYLRIPSVSTDPAYAADVSRCCDFLVEAMRSSGLQAKRVDTEGHPLAYGQWCGAAGRPTVLFYGHYDVQPPDPIDAWHHPPFEPTVVGDRLVARGATDDKGQSFTHLKAVEAMLERRGGLPVNVKFLVEGEEESGGTALDRFVREDRGATLGCDCVMISDGDMYAPGQPSLLYGLKGIISLAITVEGPDRDLHSGTYGGAVANPANVLCWLIGRLQDPETGRIRIPGFYDDVRPLDRRERRELARLPFDERVYALGLGVPELFGEAGFSPLERLWARPTCDVNGLTAGYQGPGGKTVLPARATAKLSLRLVPDQNPERIAALTRRYLEQIAWPAVRVRTDYRMGTPAVRIDPEGPFMDAAATALEEIWGRRPVWVRDGGSLPVVSTFSEVLEVPIVLAGFGLADDAPHSPNEKLELSHFYRGIRTTARFLDLVSEVRPGG